MFFNDVLKVSIDVSVQTKTFLNMSPILFAALHMSMSPLAGDWKLHKSRGASHYLRALTCGLAEK